MSDQVCGQMPPPSRWDRFVWQVSHRSWWYTTRIASPLHRWTRWTQEPGPHWGGFEHRWLAGLNVACWTHMCGHGLVYSFRVGCIYWAPRYAKRVLRLP